MRHVLQCLMTYAFISSIHILCVSFTLSVYSLTRANFHHYSLASNLFCGIHYRISFNRNIWRLSYHTADTPLLWPHYELYWNPFYLFYSDFPYCKPWGGVCCTFSQNDCTDKVVIFNESLLYLCTISWEIILSYGINIFTLNGYLLSAAHIYN